MASVGARPGARGREGAHERGRARCELVIIRTSGDRMTDQPLADAGGKRLFVKEIEDALLAGIIDVAVHSSKDLPVDLPDGLDIGAVLPREDPVDVWVAREGPAAGFDTVTRGLARGTRIGTGSVRRIARPPVLPHDRCDRFAETANIGFATSRTGLRWIVAASAALRARNLAIASRLPFRPTSAAGPGPGISHMKPVGLRRCTRCAGARRLLAPKHLETERCTCGRLGSGAQCLGALCGAWLNDGVCVLEPSRPPRARWRKSRR